MSSTVLDDGYRGTLKLRSTAMAMGKAASLHDELESARSELRQLRAMVDVMQAAQSGLENEVTLNASAMSKPAATPRRQNHAGMDLLASISAEAARGKSPHQSHHEGPLIVSPTHKPIGDSTQGGLDPFDLSAQVLSHAVKRLACREMSPSTDPTRGWSLL